MACVLLFSFVCSSKQLIKIKNQVVSQVSFQFPSWNCFATKHYTYNVNNVFWEGISKIVCFRKFGKYGILFITFGREDDKSDIFQKSSQYRIICTHYNFSFWEQIWLHFPWEMAGFHHQKARFWPSIYFCSGSSSKWTFQFDGNLKAFMISSGKCWKMQIIVM